MEVILDNLTVKLNGKHQMPLFAMFKGSSNDIPATSEKSIT